MKLTWQNLLLSSTKRMFSPSKIVLFSGLLAAFLVSGIVTALAAFREQPYLSFIQTNATARFATNAFGQGGFAYIAGGVVLDGRAEFYLEDSQNKEAVSPADLALNVDEHQNVYLTYRGVSYQLEAHAGVACPLGKFVVRNGLVLYTVPPPVPGSLKDEQNARIREGGLVRSNRGFIAKEFENSKFGQLLRGLDFAQVVPLPDNLNNKLVQEINDTIGKDRQLAKGFGAMGSYVNTDSQIIYKTYLVARTKRVDIAGVPLRYDWDYATDGSAFVNFVTAYSTKWQGAPQLADLANNNARISQYDYVTFYQIGGIFRQMFMSNEAAFRSFVDKACAS